MGRNLTLLVSSSGEKEIAARLEQMASDVTRMRPVMEEILGLIVAAQKGAYGRGPALSQRTLDDKQRAGFPKTKLVRTGKLRQTLTTAEGGDGAIRVASNTTLLFGTDAWYGIFAKSGTKSGEPKRYVMGFGPKMRSAIRMVVLEHLGWKL